MSDLFKDTDLQAENMRLQVKLRSLERQVAENQQIKQDLLAQLKNYYAKLTDALLANKKLHHQVNHLRNKYNRLWLEKHDQQLSELEKKIKDDVVVEKIQFGVPDFCHLNGGEHKPQRLLSSSAKTSLSKQAGNDLSDFDGSLSAKQLKDHLK